MPSRKEYGMVLSSIPEPLHARTHALLLVAKVAKTSGGPGMAERLKVPTPPVRLLHPKTGGTVMLMTNHAICGSHRNITAD